MKYYLHYVGSKLYPKSIFIKEAQTLGVNRCLPNRIIKHLKWGDRILLGNFIPNPTIAINLTDKRKNKKDGIAEVFGYFEIEGLNLMASKEFKDKLRQQLNINASVPVPLTPIQRQCGSYTLSSAFVVSDTIKEIIEKAEKIPINEKVKFFVTGPFHQANLTVNNINFTRTIIEVETSQMIFPTLNTNLPPPTNNVLGMIDNYNKRSYIAKKPRKKK
jgi:hypothetical protein